MQVYSNLTLPHKVAIVPVVLRFTVDLASIEANFNHMNNPIKCLKSIKKETWGGKEKAESDIICDICPIKEFSSRDVVLAHRFVSFTYPSIP